MEAFEQPTAFRVVTDDTGETGTSAKRRDVVGRIARAARHNLGGVVLEDQNGSLARHAGNFSVDVLVGDQVANDQHTPAAEAIDEAEQTFFALGFSWKRMDGSRNQHSLE